MMADDDDGGSFSSIVDSEHEGEATGVVASGLLGSGGGDDQLGCLVVPRVGQDEEAGREGLLSEGDGSAPRRRGTSVGFASLTLIMSVVGTGLLSLPAAFKCLGAFAGTATLAVVSAAMFFTGDLMVKSHLACSTPRPLSYEGLVVRSCEVMKEGSFWHTHGAKAKVAVNLVNAVGLFGGCCAYITIGKDIFPALRERFGLDDQGLVVSTDFVTAFFVLAVSFPLSLRRNLSNLGYTSVVGFIFSLYMVLVISVRGLVRIGQGEAKWPSVWARACDPEDSAWASFVTAVSVFNFSFVFHFNVLPVFKELPPPKQTHLTMRIVLLLTTVCCFFLYALLGVTGFALFGSETQGNIFNNFSAKGDDAINLARIAICACCFLCLPLLEHPLRSTLMSLLNIRSTRYSRALVTFLTMACQYVAALLAPSVKVVLQITGGSAIVGFCFVFPVSFALCLLGSDLRLFDRVVCWFILVGSPIVGLWAVAQTFYSL